MKAHKRKIEKGDIMNRNLDVWAIQKHPKALYTALENVKTDTGDLILFTNLECSFTLGGKKVQRSFETALYYDDQENNQDALILLMKDGQATPEQIREYLEKESLKYHEVSFAKDLKKELLEEFDIPHKEEKQNEAIPELWFAREEYVLRDALTESIKMGNTTCDYYPLLQGFLNLNYTDNNTDSIQDSSHNIDGRRILGVIALEDKMILMINSENDYRNLSPFQVHKVMEELGISVNVHQPTEFNIENPYQSKIKEKR